jgi:putative salt-induced outer membrane protein
MATIRVIATATTLLSCAPVLTALADEAPAPPPPQHTWIGKGQFGFLDSRGNSDSESLNANLDVLRYDGDWKNDLYVGGLYGKSSGIVSAERWEIREQTDYNITKSLFTFGGLRFEHDQFDGFVYQGSVTAGMGYKILDTNDTKLTAQAGVGYRRLRPETIDKADNGEVISRTPGDASGNAIGTVGVDFSHAFTKTTVFTNKFLTEAGSDNTLLQDTLGVTVKMSDRLALSVGYGIIDNTKPPAPLKKLDTVATVNVQFGF